MAEAAVTLAKSSKNVLSYSDSQTNNYDPITGHDVELRYSIAICGFLELAIHQLLAVKKVYPMRVFEKITRYKHTTWKCTNEGVSKFVVKFLDFVHGLLIQEERMKVVFILKKDCGEILEQYVFIIKASYARVDDPEELIRIVDRMIPICTDINSPQCVSEKTPTKYQNVQHIEELFADLTFELQIRVRASSFIPPSYKKDYPYVIYTDKHTTSGFRKIISLSKDKSDFHEIEAFAYHMDGDGEVIQGE